MDDVKRKVYLDIFASPVTLLPVVGGLTALLASWAIGGSALLTFAGVAGVVGGLGLFASRLIFGLEKLTNRAYQYVLERQQKKQAEALHELDKKLQRDRDPRTERLLRQLWHLYKTLEKDIQAGKISVAAHEVLESVDRMFQVCVDYLDRSYQLWDKAHKQAGPARQRTMHQRDELVTEVENSVDFLESKIDQLENINKKKSKSELSELRAELDETIRVARRAEERTAELTGEGKNYDESEFE